MRRPPSADRRRLFHLARAASVSGTPIRKPGTWAVRAFLGVAAIMLSTGTLRAQETVGIVRAVEFIGLVRTDEALVRDVAAIQIGEPISREELDAAVVRLLRTGRFTTARYDILPEEDGVRIRFDLTERTFVSAIRFQGNSRFSDNRLRREVPVQVDQAVDPFSARDGQEAILRLYREEGFADASVEFDREQLQRTGELVYVIEEGPRTRIRRIEFEGNTAFSDRVLRRQIQTKKAFWILRTGAFDEDVVDGDVAALQTYYRDRGWLDARVSYRREPVENGIRLVFTIVEGTRYVIEGLTLTGNTVFSTEELMALIESREGQFVNRPRLDDDAQAIRRRYGEIGHIYTEVRVIRVFSEQPGAVRVTFQIEEGDAYRVGEVVVRGNSRTKDKVVRRELNLCPPDDLWNMTEVRDAERSLVDSRIFRSARVLPVGDEPGVRDAVIDVVEADRLGDFIFGAGITSNSGVVGQIVLDLQNFDLFDTPRSLSELFRFRAFSGAGQRLRLELRPGTETSRFRVDFTEPYLFDRPIRFDYGAYLFTRDREAYAETRVGTTVSFGRRFERGWFRNWTGEVTFRVEEIEVDSVDLFAGDQIHDDEGQSFLTSVRYTMVRDRTDNRFVPTVGDRLRLSYEQVGALGGDHVFGEIRSRYSRYFTVATDAEERKSVLELWGEGGYQIGDAPVYERLYAGGIGSIRGFEFRGIGPRDGFDDTNVGADYLILLGGEYSFPVYGKNLRGHVFLDSGTAGSGYRAAVGAGVRFTIDVLGPIPLEFNLAAPVLRDSEDEEQILSFVIGGIF